MNSKKFKEKYKTLPLNPIMPRNYNAKERAKLRQWEKELLEEWKLKENIEKQLGE